MSLWPTEAGSFLEWSSFPHDIWHYTKPEYEAISNWQISEDPVGIPAKVEFIKNQYGHLTPSWDVLSDERLPAANTVCLYNIVSDRDLEALVDRTFVGEIGYGAGVTLYGSLIGPDIDGNPFKLDIPEFVLMDIRLGNSWLHQQLVKAYGGQFYFRTPKTTYGNVFDVLSTLRAKSVMSDFCLTKDVPVRGVIVRPLVELSNGNGERVIARLRANQPGVVR